MFATQIRCWFVVSFLLTASPAAQAQIRFGDLASFQSFHGQFLVAEVNGSLNANRPEIGDWEQFRLIDPDQLSNTGEIHFGDRIALSSAHATYVTAEAGGGAVADRTQLASWEIWKILDPFEPTSQEPVDPRQLVALLSDHDTYMVAENDGRANADRLQIGDWERWRIGVAWTDFYYDRAPPCPPGTVCRCPIRGRFDGANCFIGRPPYGADAFLSAGDFYYSRPDAKPCSLGTFDGAHCKVGNNPTAPHPFVYDSGFYLASLFSETDTLKARIDRIAHCSGGVLPCNHQLTRAEYLPWVEAGVPKGIQRNTQLGIVFEPPDAPARRVALFLAGQQYAFVPGDPQGSKNIQTGQPDDFKKDWSYALPWRDFTLNDSSLAHRVLEDEILQPDLDFLAVAFDARFHHKFTKKNKNRIVDAYYRWLRTKFDPETVELVYLAGHSRGGCLAMRLAQRIQQEIPGVPVVAQSFDGVCNRNQSEIGIEAPGKVDNPLSGSGSSYGWPTDLGREFDHRESSLALLHLVGGRDFIPGDLLVRAFSEKWSTEPVTDLCWYRQEWRDLGHGAFGSHIGMVSTALDHLKASMNRFTNGPACSLSEFDTVHFGDDFWFKGGGPIHQPVAGDFDNDGKVDDIVYYGRCGNGDECWRAHLGDGNGFTAKNFGGDMWFGGSDYAHTPVSGDFDNDGFIDDIAYYGLCGNGEECWRVHLSNGTQVYATGFGGGMWFGGGNGTHRPVSGDFDNDGFIDDIAYYGLCGNGEECWRVHLGNGSSFHSTSFGSDMWFGGSGHDQIPLAGDFDGDGFRDDILYYGLCGNDAHRCWRVHRSNGGSFTTEDFGNNAWFDSGAWPVMPAVANVDGLPGDEIVYAGRCGAGRPCWRVHAYNGSGFTPKSFGEPDVWFAGSGPPHVPLTGDFNGIGRDDIVYYGRCGQGDTCWRVHLLD